ncbi:3-oxoadipate enol-lactonase 2 [Pseudoprimorskyibacter insulae]|uniref:3-oxoadipate enol-lactonase 2 n=1 Tax=Pseudoprimorskyibacter insulae TaxID=1695997 RepID=A0A2R8AZQ2_9RHOB|nr:3-oxoadipate enol-lactonase 2 [Pseudoprimorskyibacter insulae]
MSTGEVRNFPAPDGADMAVHVWPGADSGTPLLCLHSLFFDGRMFQPVVALLDQMLTARPTVYAPDFRGQGASSMGDLRPLMQTLAKDVLALLDYENLEQVHVLGSSMGGYVAMELMRLAPERMSGVVLSCCTGEAEADPARFFQLADRLQHEGAKALTEMLLQTMFGDSFLAANSDLLHLWRKRFSELPPSIAEVVRGVFEHPDYGGTLSGFTKPILSIGGGEDRAKSPANARWIADRASNGTFAVIEKSGHTPPVEAPNVYVDLFTPFLSQLGAWRNTSLAKDMK